MPDFTVPYHCPITGRWWDAGRTVEEFDGEVPDIDKVRRVLALPPIDNETGAGFTDVVAEAAYEKFVEWLESKNDSVSSGPNFVQPTTASPPNLAPGSCSGCG